MIGKDDTILFSKKELSRMVVAGGTLIVI